MELSETRVHRGPRKGTNLRGQTPICGFLRVPAVFCGFLRKSAVFCENQRFSNVGVQETVLLVNHALARGTPAIFVIFVVSRGGGGFPKKTRPISDAFLTHSCYCQRLFRNLCLSNAHSVLLFFCTASPFSVLVTAHFNSLSTEAAEGVKKAWKGGGGVRWSSSTH